jgi:hypothetical protein
MTAGPAAQPTRPPGQADFGAGSHARQPSRAGAALRLRSHGWCVAIALVAAIPAFGASAERRAVVRAHRARHGLAKPFFRMSEAEAAATLRRIHEQHATMKARIAAISERFVGTPYRFDPLGEGAGAKEDPDPTFDLSRVDCLTMIEEIIAMAHAPELSRAKSILQRIRYADGRITFAHRHHFAESQWIPANQALGVLRDITHQVGGDAVVDSRKRLGARVWSGKWRRWRTRLGARLPRGEFVLPVLPLEAAIRRLDSIPAGSILSVVRVDRPRTPTRISHQGIVVQKGGRRFLRHASSGPNFRRVIDYPLISYLRFSQRYFRNRWRVLGINLQEIVQSPALAAAD